MEKINILVAFIGGILSIFSPCIIPILPSFLGYISGISLSSELKNSHQKTVQLKLFLHTLFFTIGFSIVFLLFGAVIGILGKFLLTYQEILQKLGGIIIIIFGLQLTGIFKFKFLLTEKHLQLPSNLEFKSYFRSFIIGIFFAFGWTPCYGPVIGTIFTLAASSANFNTSLMLFFFYSLGFIIPLLIMSAFIGHISKFLKKYPIVFKYSSYISGFLMISLGILLLTNQLNILVNWINFNYTENNLNLFS